MHAVRLESRTWPIDNAPQLYEILGRLKEWGFVAFDIINRNYHDVAGYLKQFDLVAVKEDSFFRTPASYTSLAHPESVRQVFENIIAGKLRKRQLLLERLGERTAGAKDEMVS